MDSDTDPDFDKKWILDLNMQLTLNQKSLDGFKTHLFGNFNNADFKYDNTLLKFHPNNTQIKCVWSQIKTFLGFFGQILQLDKSEGFGFKYDNSFLKLQPKNTKIGHFGPKFKYFCFFQ